MFFVRSSLFSQGSKSPSKTSHQLTKSSRSSQVQRWSLAVMDLTAWWGVKFLMTSWAWSSHYNISLTSSMKCMEKDRRWRTWLICILGIYLQLLLYVFPFIYFIDIFFSFDILIYPTLKIINHIAEEHIGKMKNNVSPVTLRLLVSPEEFEPLRQASFKSPFCI